MNVVPYVSEREREWVSVMGPAVELAKQVANTEFVPRNLRGNGAAIVAAILYGDELGLGPMQALSKISVIEGKPTLSAETQRALILAAGHDIWIVEATSTKVTVAGRRAGSDNTSTVTWTMDDAKRANLAGRQNWRTYPRQMLLARATAELARLIFADAIGGLATTEELEETANGNPANSEVATKKSNRRKRETTAEPSTSVVEEVVEETAELPPLPDEPFEFGGTPVPVDEPEAASLPSSSEGDTPSSPEDQAPVAASGSQKPTPGQKKKIGVFVKELRDEKHVVTTEQLWANLATARGRDVDFLILGLDGRDEEGVLHFGPLLADLNRSEASRLIDWFERVEQHVKDNAGAAA